MLTNSRISRFLIFILACMLLSSCQSHSNNPDQTDEKHETGQTDTEAPRSVYYFKSSRFYDENYVLTKTNLRTGITTPVCDDPLCEHGYDCRFSNAFSPCLVGTTVYFYRDAGFFMEDGEAYMTTQICSYDYEKGDYRVLLEIDHTNDENVCGKFEVQDGKIFFYQTTLVDNREKFSLREIDIATGKLTEYDWAADDWHFTMQNGRLYFTNVTEGIYSTDLHLQDQLFLVSPSEDTLIYSNILAQNGKLYYRLQDQSKEETLMVFDPEAGNQTAIDTANTFQYVRAIGNTVYYLKTSFVGGNMWNQDHGNTVYKWDGNEATVFYVHDKEILALNECEGYLIIDEEGGERHIIKVE